MAFSAASLTIEILLIYILKVRRQTISVIK